MRTILFRGQKADTKEWIFGDLIQLEKDFKKVVEILDWSKVDNKKKSKSDLTVIEETVGQFTGLTDKNGKQIFEGDILGGCYGSINGHEWKQEPILIKFAEGRFNVPLLFAKGEWDSTHYLVIIGNMHDNPELIESSF